MPGVSISSRFIYLLKIESSQPSAEFGPLLTTTCFSITDCPQEQKGAHLFIDQVPEGFNMCAVQNIYIYALYIYIIQYVLCVYSEPCGDAVRYALTITAGAGFVAHVGGKSVRNCSRGSKEGRNIIQSIAALFCL